MEKCLFAVPLLTWCPQIAQIYTYIFKIFAGVTAPDPQNWGGLRLLPLEEHPLSHFFRASAATAVSKSEMSLHHLLFLLCLKVVDSGSTSKRLCLDVRAHWGQPTMLLRHHHHCIWARDPDNNARRMWGREREGRGLTVYVPTWFMRPCTFSHFSPLPGPCLSDAGPVAYYSEHAGL